MNGCGFSRFLACAHGILSQFALGDVDVLDQNPEGAVAEESRDSGDEPALFVRPMAGILQRELFALPIQNGADAGGEPGGLASLGADRPIAHSQVVDSLAEVAARPVCLREVLPGPVHRYDRAFVVQYAYVGRKGVDGSLGELLGFSYDPFGLLAQGDIGREADVTEELAGRREARLRV